MGVIVSRQNTPVRITTFQSCHPELITKLSHIWGLERSSQRKWCRVPMKTSDAWKFSFFKLAPKFFLRNSRVRGKALVIYL